MGEEEKNPAEEKKPEEGKKSTAEEKKKEEAAKSEKPAEDGKEEDKKSKDQAPPPKEIVLRVFMHCEGCARKVRRSLKGFEGVEEVITDCRTSKVVVKGEKADPLKVFERVQRKSHRQVELIFPVPPPPVKAPENPDEKEVVVRPLEKKEEPAVITVVLGVYMHCEACAQEIKKRILRMKGVESVEPDLKSSQVTVKGVVEPEKLADHVYKRTGKHAAIIKVEPGKKEEEKAKDGKEEKKAEEGGKDVKTGEEGAKESKEGGGEPPAKPDATAEDAKMELKKSELYYYYPQNYQLNHQRFIQEMNAYPPQMFSDENPNACSVM